MVDVVTIGEATLYCGDCRDVLPTLPAVDCVITDPPYFKVKGDYWDNEWDKPAEFMDWMRGILGMLADRMKPNGGEYLRREYEDLRRPFSLTPRDQWSDVWDFDPVAAYPGKHPCEKPIPLLAHMLNVSTKPGALVLDAFMGSGATGDACARLGRRFIGIERDREHFESACRRLEQQHAQAGLFA